MVGLVVRGHESDNRPTIGIRPEEKRGDGDHITAALREALGDAAFIAELERGTRTDLKDKL
jgi:hypothetical protein